MWDDILSSFIFYRDYMGIIEDHMGIIGDYIGDEIRSRYEWIIS